MAETAAQKKARLAAAAREAAYIKSLGNPITSQYDPRIAQGGRVTTGGDISSFNPEIAATQMTSSGVSPLAAVVEEEEEEDKVIPAKLISTYTDPETGDIIDVYDNGDGTTSEKIRKKGTLLATAAEEKRLKGQSAYDLLFEQFNQYGLGALVTPLKDFIQEGLSSSEFTLRLRDTDAYKKRFAANASRIAKGLSALNEAEYIGLEDQYQNIMREYGLPASYYAKGDMGRQEGFEKLIANDVSNTELEDRIMTAQSRVINANPEVLASLKQFYPGISDGDILAYTLDPEKALTDIKRKVTAAEIGGAAMQAGLKTGMTRAEELAAAGVTKNQAQQGFQTVAELAPRGGQLAEIYKQSPYTQTTAEAEVFGLAGSTEAARQRKKLTQLETAAFSGSAGAGAIARDRAGVL